MSLEDKIAQDYVLAMKQRDTSRSSTLSFLRAQIKNVKIDQRLEMLSDAEVIAVIKKQVKQRQDSITQFKAGHRMDLAQKEEQELAVLQSYLPAPTVPSGPAQASNALVIAAIEEAIKSTAATSMKDMGKVMKEVLAKLQGAADNQVVGPLVKERLSKMS